jgi:hypothetical protein
MLIPVVKPQVVGRTGLDAIAALYCVLKLGKMNIKTEDNHHLPLYPYGPAECGRQGRGSTNGARILGRTSFKAKWGLDGFPSRL